MNRPETLTSKLDDNLSLIPLREPFAVLIDTQDPEWDDKLWTEQKTRELIEAGCRFFVCFGPDSEAVHDRIDDVIVAIERDFVVLTTFHCEESKDDVANFFRTIATKGMSLGLAFVRDQDEWKGVL